MTDDAVNIYCNRGHRQAREAVAAFVRTPGCRWELQGCAEVDPREEPSGPTLGRMVWLDGRGAASERLPRWAPRSGERRAYSLRCPRCRLQVDVLDERLQLALAAFHAGQVAAGRVFEDVDAPEWLRLRVSRVALSALAASLT